MTRSHWCLNTLWPRQDGSHFSDHILKGIFLNENVLILIKISLKFVPKGLINNIPALVQIMAWRRPGDKPLSEPVMARSLTHICVTRPQWLKIVKDLRNQCHSSYVYDNSIMDKINYIIQPVTVGWYWNVVTCVVFKSYMYSVVPFGMIWSANTNEIQLHAAHSFITVQTSQYINSDS